MFHIPDPLSLIFNYTILEEESLVLTQGDLIYVLMDFKRHSNHIKKNQEEMEIFRLNEQVKEHLQKKKMCQEQITLTAPNFIPSMVGKLALESRGANKPRGLAGEGGKSPLNAPILSLGERYLYMRCYHMPE